MNIDDATISAIPTATFDQAVVPFPHLGASA
jgi:hypothetical protein